MEMTECKHQHRMNIKDYTVDVFPMGTKKCDSCGREIHLNWVCRILYMLVYCIVPGTFFVIFTFRVLFGLALLIFPAAMALAFYLTWLITRYGRYVLKK